MMPRIALIVICVALGMPVHAQATDKNDIELLAKVESSLISWFQQLSTSVDQIADNEDRRRIKAALQKLHGSIYEVETDGRDLVTQLETTPLNAGDAHDALVRTRDAVVSLKLQLHATGLQLQSQDRAGGAKVEEMIANAIEKRTIWLGDVDGQIATHHISQQTIKDGHAILGQQESASVALNEVIEKLGQ